MVVSCRAIIFTGIGRRCGWGRGRALQCVVVYRDSLVDQPLEDRGDFLQPRFPLGDRETERPLPDFHRERFFPDFGNLFDRRWVGELDIQPVAAEFVLEPGRRVGDDDAPVVTLSGSRRTS